MKNDEKYYRMAHEALPGSETNPGFKYLKNLIASFGNPKVLDVGSGDGSRLNYFLNQKHAYGVEINLYAKKQSSAHYPQFEIKLYDGQKIPFEDGTFDISYSTYVLEHTKDPFNFIREMLRVTKKKGWVVILCPNYGAPNRRSPNSIENPFKKLFSGLFRDIVPSRKLLLKSVIPKNTYNQIDDDTTIEPYLLTIERYFKSINLSIKESDSLWQLEEKSINPRKIIIKTLGKAGIFPFRYWGPHLFIVVQHQSEPKFK